MSFWIFFLQENNSNVLINNKKKFSNWQLNFWHCIRHLLITCLGYLFKKKNKNPPSPSSFFKLTSHSYNYFILSKCLYWYEYCLSKRFEVSMAYRRSLTRENHFTTTTPSYSPLPPSSYTDHTPHFTRLYNTATDRATY